MAANSHAWRRDDGIRAQIQHLRILADTCPNSRMQLNLQQKIEALQAKLALDVLRKLRERKARDAR